MKDLKRLAASAEMLNHPDQYLVLQLQDHDGGEFGLFPRIDDNAVYFPAPSAPGYRLAISGTNPDVLERTGKALLTLARNQRKLAAGEEPDADDTDE